MMAERQREPEGPKMSDKLRDTLLGRPLKVINVGLEGFAQDLERQGVAVVRVDWRPPAGGDPKLADLLSKLGTGGRERAQGWKKSNRPIKKPSAACWRPIRC